MAENLTLTRDGHVAVLTIDRPEKRNAMSDDMRTAFIHALEQVAADQASGERRSFRMDAFADEVSRLVPAGNVYVNRSVIGAVVGVQPFGGEGLSGTGPKAGGPHSLIRFAAEKAVSVNIAAQGGDPALLNL